MKISAIELFDEAMPLTRPYTIAFRTIADVRMNFVALHTTSGLVGLGCASPEPHVTGETYAACSAALEPQALQWLEGEDVRALPRLCRTLHQTMKTTPAARAALDMALHDLLAQHLGVPLVELLGRAHHALPTSITIGIKNVDDTLEEAREYVARGFKVLKVKLGHDLEQDIARLSRLREALQPAPLIRVDPNQGYDAAALAQFVKRTACLGIEFLEQPMPAIDIDAMRSLPDEIRAQIAADESLLSEADALLLATPPRACGIFNIKLMKCGGIWSGMRIANVAELAGIDLMWGCMDESIISISAALHAAFASPATRYLDLDGSLDLARDVVSGGFELKDGVMRTLDRPGLGLTRL
ncbi:MAG: L-alanine-DL-glutamate epimerase-like enolase superfamily enzyme [Gammaproteobacteria bacterium]|jgi:L-alanine-DL-glutamate epimerase-like enolase superfamily enzyme